MSVEALHGFRRLLRASRTIFGRDIDGLNSARVFIRQQFEDNREEKGPEVLAELIYSIDDAIGFAKSNIVQAELNDRGNFEAELSDEHAELLKSNPQISEATDPVKISSGGCQNSS